MSIPEKKNRHELTGIDGSNPLGFLAALGTLRSLSLANPELDVRLGWAANSAWNPVLVFNQPLSQDDLVELLNKFLASPSGKESLELGDNIKFSPVFFHEAAVAAFTKATQDEQESLRYLASFGSEAISSAGLINDTAFRTMSGAGHQHFLKFMRDLIVKTTETHLKAALFDLWKWEDDQPSLRWDPYDDRRYALRWKEPSGDPIKTVRGANRLAIEAIPLMTTVPKGNRLYTVGFMGKGSRNTYLTWPIWEHPIGLDTVGSVLTLSPLQKPELEPDEYIDLKARGICEIFRSQRLTIGKYRNFTQAISVCPTVETTPTIKALKGLVPPPRRKLTLEEMDKAIARGASKT